jgi:hypothetical protein
MDVGNIKDAAQVKVEGTLSHLHHAKNLMNSVPRPLRSPAIMHPDHRSKYPRNPNSLERVSSPPHCSAYANEQKNSKSRIH